MYLYIDALFVNATRDFVINLMQDDPGAFVIELKCDAGYLNYVIVASSDPERKELHGYVFKNGDTVTPNVSLGNNIDKVNIEEYIDTFHHCPHCFLSKPPTTWMRQIVVWSLFCHRWADDDLDAKHECYQTRRRSRRQMVNTSQENSSYDRFRFAAAINKKFHFTLLPYRQRINSCAL